MGPADNGQEVVSRIKENTSPVNNDSKERVFLTIAGNY